MAFSEAERFAVAIIEDLQAAFRERAAEQYRQFPAMRPPCHTCAINPGTNGWPGQPPTALRFLAALAQGAPFYCHDGMPRDEHGWHPTGKDPLCAGWAVLSTLPRERLHQAITKALREQHGEEPTYDRKAVDEVLSELIAIVA